ncbi:NADH-quinone oxidoreductase subunit NuoN [Pyruvatibacter mobilis]|jgi:NADH-quinone oxidoreductase subunit N|uniref:NADH-quinone oxidoreductase subunit NuoN n=1 Tax=Pyruvatibacter mobilis TaxID=1712261 RepID=UPI003BA8C5F9
MPDIAPVLPEIILAVGAMALLMFGVFRKEDDAGPVAIGGIVLFAITGFAVVTGDTGVTFGDSFIADGFSTFIKVLVLIGAAATLFMGLSSMKADNLNRFEYPVLLVLATLGMFMMVSANGLIALYIGIELQSLALYVVAAFKRDSLRSSEAGLKYFVLGALSSGMLLYGASLLYGFAGTVTYAGLGEVLQGDVSIGVIFGLVFFLAGIAFKMSAVPFHMWTPDVYEGAPTPATAFFAAAPKVAAVAMLVRAVTEAFPGVMAEWQQIVFFMAVASTLLGAFAAIGQSNIKRLMAYSSIANVGFILIGLAAGTKQGVEGVLIYLVIYLAMTIGTFACILAMRRAEGPVENIEDLAGLSRNQPMLAFVMAMLMFSLAGIPPLAGFFAKYYVFLAAIEAGLYALAIIGVLASVVGAYYYLRIVKVMYFDEPAAPFEQPMARDVRLVLTLSSLFVLLFFVFPAPVLDSAAAAAGALF